MIGFYLEDELRHCPQHWQNFIRTNKKDIYSDINVSIQIINRLLRPYGARYVEADYLDQDNLLLPYGARYVEADYLDQDKVVFEDEKDLTLFILKWS